MGAKKKSKAHILKYVPCILKYLRPIFCPLKTRLKTVPKRRTNRDKPFDRFLCALLYVLSGFVEKFKNSAPQTLAKMFPP